MTPRRITVVASEVLGRPGTGGAGTADSLLAVALGRNGHDVRLLVASGRAIELNSTWAKIYGDAGVEVQILQRLEDACPPYLAPAFEVYQALRDAPPEVAILDEWRGLGFLALRARQAGLALRDTAFVITCHSPGRVLTTFAHKVPDTLDRFGEQVMEQASIELADAVVSPTRWLLEWLSTHGWRVPETASVIPYVRQSAALAQTPAPASGGVPIRRLAFFGQLREGKGIRLFVDALASIHTDLLDGRELLFLGSARGRWARECVEDALAPRVRRAASVRFETDLDRDAALAELRRPGTLAVMPSLLDNAPNTVSECIEHGIPFIASATGGIPELVAAEDRARVLVSPTAQSLAEALTRALAADTPIAPARAANDPAAAVDAWLQLVDAVEAKPPPQRPAPKRVDIVAVGRAAPTRARQLARSTRSVEVAVVEAETRGRGFPGTNAEWILFLDDDDVPEPQLVDALVAAQAASGADVVTPAVRLTEKGDALQLFLGDPGALGLVTNQYGVIGLIRRSLAAADDLPECGVDPDWPLFARLALAGATIVSIPELLADHQVGGPGRVTDVPGDGLRVLEAFEESGIDLVDLPQLAATLGAALGRETDRSVGDGQPPAARARRGIASLVRATLARR